MAKELIACLQSPWIKEVRGTGLMIGIELNAETFTNRGAFQSAERSPALLMVDRLQAAGLLAVPSGTHVIRWLPPLNVSQAEVNQAVSILSGVLDSLG